ncbi:MAG: hypothetical protein O3C43_00960 [Verrucomicrobia bacterium]|nr:hypothetical protein [Verrucomicrobiota bacterium]MDA1065048.1 hypothetical protein [Verrucomicrobiota bacterium]
MTNEGGSFNIEDGQLNIIKTSDIEGGSIGVAGNSTLQFQNIAGQLITFTQDTAISGVGNVVFAGVGKVVVDGNLSSRLTFPDSTSGFYFANGSTVEINGTVTNLSFGEALWNGTYVQGEGEYINEGTLEIQGQRLLTTLVNNPAGVVNQTGDLQLAGGTINIQENSVYNLFNGNVVNGGGVNELVVLGSLNKKASSTLSSTIHVPIKALNNALIAVEADATKDLFLNAGGVISNKTKLSIAARGSRLLLQSGTFTSGELGSEVEVEGGGKFVISSNANWTLNNPGDRVFFRQYYIEDLLETSRGVDLLGTLKAAAGASFMNESLFFWNGGTIEGGTSSIPAFLNVNSNTTELVAWVQIEGNCTLNGFFRNEWTVTMETGSLNLTEGSEFQNHGGFGVNSGSSSILGPGTFMNYGSVTAEGNVNVSSRFHPNNGTVFILGSHSGSMTLTNLIDTVEDDTLKLGKWVIFENGTLNIPGHTIKRVGAGAEVEFHKGATFPQFQPDLIEPGGNVVFKGDFEFPGALNNAGKLLSESARLNATKVENESNGKIESALQFLNESIVIAKGNVPFESVTYEKGFAVSEGFENAGYLYPGGTGAPGYFPITGEFTQTASGIIDLELGGKTNAAETPAEYDQLAVIGTATLNGNLLVRFLDDFAGAIQASDSFTILKATTITGAFSNAPNGGRVHLVDDTGSFLVTYSEKDVTLTDFQPGPGEDAPEEPTLVVEFSEGTNSATLSVIGDPGEAYFLESSLKFIGWDIITEVLLDEQGMAVHQQPLNVEATQHFFRTRIK